MSDAEKAADQYVQELQQEYPDRYHSKYDVKRDFLAVDEKTELDGKIARLNLFIGESAQFSTLDAAEQERMKVQLDLMVQYSEVLGQRIAAFTD